MKIYSFFGFVFSGNFIKGKTFKATIQGQDVDNPTKEIRTKQTNTGKVSQNTWPLQFHLDQFFF